jgi:hypothetical protein
MAEQAIDPSKSAPNTGKIILFFIIPLLRLPGATIADEFGNGADGQRPVSA